MVLLQQVLDLICSVSVRPISKALGNWLLLQRSLHSLEIDLCLRGHVPLSEPQVSTEHRGDAKAHLIWTYHISVLFVLTYDIYIYVCVWWQWRWRWSWSWSWSWWYLCTFYCLHLQYTASPHCEVHCEYMQVQHCEYMQVHACTYMHGCIQTDRHRCIESYCTYHTIACHCLAYRRLARPLYNTMS